MLTPQSFSITHYIPLVEEVEWPVGVTPDINAVKARISRRHQRELKETATTEKDKLASMQDSESSWLDVGRNSELWYYNESITIRMCHR